jgi:hypothetical protein
MAGPSEMGISSATITLRAANGHELSAYRADPAAPPIGGLVVLQEIFGQPFDLLRSA